MPTINGINVTGAACDSRLVEPGNLFICKGANFKKDFLISAIEKGAVAYLSEVDYEVSIPLIKSVDIRKDQAKYSKLAWGKPDEKMTMIGITGTKGKTTVATFIKNAIEACGHKCGFIGTHHVYDGKDSSEPPNTTPEPPDLYRYLAHMVENGCEYCVMEVSSQGLKYDRVLGLDLDVAAITNIGVDHIAPVEHPTVQDYVESKFKIADITKKLFINEDLVLCEEARPYVEAGLAKLPTAEVCASPLVEGCSPEQVLDNVPVAHYPATPGNLLPGNWAGNSCLQQTSTSDCPETLHLKMPGTYNAQNAVLSLEATDYLNLNHEKSKAAMQDTQVAGRMEVFASQDGRLVGIVDYAHTKESYEKFFNAIDFDGYVIAYFGASGGKALDRHVDLPQTAAKYCDYIIVTSDDPGTEKPEDVVASVESNLPEGFPHECIVSRDDACNRAFELAAERLKSGEHKVFVCALGKGDENVCVCSTGDIPIIPDNKHVAQKIEEYNKDPGLFDLAATTTMNLS